MEYIREISLNEAVVHILDINSDEPILNEQMLELNEELHNFILKHIEKALRDEELKYAIFNPGRGIVKELAQEYLTGDNNLLQVSRELASQLFMLMKANTNIPSCDLMVVSFSTEYGPMIGILKMDYVKNFTHKIDFVESRMSINIIPQSAGLPGSGQRLHKCAFIKPLSEDASFNLMVIDKTVKSKESEEYGANYFISSYLGCSIVNNERDMTKSFVKAAESWTRNNIDTDADKAEIVRSTIKKKLREEDSIDIRTVSEEIFQGDKNAQENFVQYIAAQGLEERINIDKEWVDKKLKRVRLKIDKDIDLYINEDAYHDGKRFEIQRNGDGSINMILKHVINYIEK